MTLTLDCVPSLLQPGAGLMLVALLVACPWLTGWLAASDALFSPTSSLEGMVMSC